MSNYENTEDKLRAHYEELERKHRELDDDLIERFNNQTITDEVRRLKTMKLYLKDEMHRIDDLLLVQSLNASIHCVPLRLHS